MDTLNKTLIKNIFIKHPVAKYYFVTFLISWGGLVLIMAGLRSSKNKYFLLKNIDQLF